MHRIRHLLTTLAVAWPLAAPLATVQAQQGPSLSQSVYTTAELSQAQRTEVENYVTHWVNAIATGDPEQVAAGRDKLVHPFITLGGSSLSGTFRDRFSRSALPKLEPLITSDEPIRVVNALIVVPFIGTGDALDVLLKHISASDEPRTFARIRAARGVEALLGSRGADLPAGKMNGYVRRLRTAAAEETHVWSLRHLIVALAGISRPPVANETARTALVATLGSVVSRIASAGDVPSPLVDAYRVGTVHARGIFYELPAGEQEAFGSSLAPTLGAFLNAAMGHQERAKEDPTYASAVGHTELLLKLIDRAVRKQQVPQTQVADAWRSMDTQEFQDSVQPWLSILQNPPYKH